MVKDFGDYPHSSARLHLGKCRLNAVIRTPYFDFTPKEWREFIESGLMSEGNFDTEIETKVQSGRPMGGDAFIEKLEKATGRTLRPQKPRRFGGV